MALVNLGDHGYPKSISIPITINIGAVQPATTSNLALAHFGTAIANFLNSEKGKEIDTMIEVEAGIQSPPLSNFSRTLINEAIRELADESAAELALTLIPRLIAKLVPGPPEQTKEPEVSKDVQEFIDNINTFVDDKLDSFYTLQDPLVANVMVNGLLLLDKLADKFHIKQDQVPGLARIGLYEIIVLVDDSGSMASENRIAVLKDAVVRLFQIATAVVPGDGISVVCFENSNVKDGYHIKSETTLKEKLDEIKFNTGYGIPSPLGLNVLNPLTNKASVKQLNSPVIVVILTDGGASAGDAAAMAATIKVFNASLASKGYTGPAAKMVMCKIGTDPTADAFFTEVENITDIQDTLLVCKDNLADKLAKDPEEYTGELVNLLAKAISLGE